MSSPYDLDLIDLRKVMDCRIDCLRMAHELALQGDITTSDITKWAKKFYEFASKA